MRIVSLLPSATEIVYLLGLGDHLTGVSHECDYPRAALGKRKIIAPAFGSSGLTSQEIDGSVRASGTLPGPDSGRGGNNRSPITDDR